VCAANERPGTEKTMEASRAMKARISKGVPKRDPPPGGPGSLPSGPSLSRRRLRHDFRRAPGKNVFWWGRLAWGFIPRHTRGQDCPRRISFRQEAKILERDLAPGGRPPRRFSTHWSSRKLALGHLGRFFPHSPSSPVWGRGPRRIQPTPHRLPALHGQY